MTSFIAMGVNILLTVIKVIFLLSTEFLVLGWLFWKLFCIDCR